MIVIDLGKVRKTRAAAREQMTEIVQLLGDLACTQAERAFAVSGPLRASDPVLARGVNQVVRRHLLRATLKAIPKGWPKASSASIVEQVSDVYRGRLLALEDDLFRPRQPS